MSAGVRPPDKGEALHLLRVLTSEIPGPAPEPPPVAPVRIHEPAPPSPAPALSRPGAPPDLFFDLETLRSAAEVGGWQNSADMGLALAVVYDRGRDRWTVYRETDARDLVLDLLTAPRVVGFNIRRFDFVVLSGYVAADFTRVPVLDLLEDVHRVLGCRLSLAHLAGETLGIAKGGDGLQNLRWVAEGRWDLIEAYCRRDVEITARLFDHGREHGHLMYRDRSGRRLQLPVAWD